MSDYYNRGLHLQQVQNDNMRNTFALPREHIVRTMLFQYSIVK